MSKLTVLLLVGLAALAPRERLAQVPPPDDSRDVIEWPSREFRTIQSAIDALRDGGTLRFSGGEFVVSAPLLVNKQVVFQGAGCREQARGSSDNVRYTRLAGPRPTRVQPPSEAAGLFTFVGSGGGVVRGLELSGFDAAIQVVNSDSAEVERSRITVEDTCISETARGISSSHSAVQIIAKNVVIREVLWNGISFTTAKSLADSMFIAFGLTVANTHQACVVVMNSTFKASNAHLVKCGFNGGLPGGGGGILAVNSTVQFTDSTVNAPNGPGIAANAGTTILERSQVFLARGMGVLLFQPAASFMHDSHVWLTQPFPSGHPQAGLFGDGVVVAGAGSLWLGDTLIEDVSRAALTNYGSFVSLGDLAVRCAGVFHLEGEIYLANNFVFQDRGSNKCGCPDANGGCEAVTVGYSPPQSISPNP